MSKNNKAFLIIGLVVVAGLFLFFASGLFGNGMMDGWRSGGGMMGGRGSFGSGFMWLPTLLFLGLGIALGWLIWGRNRA
ncbi:MAG: hypothetical protein IPM21_07475 [Acidobacteria bacterium]|nr:hypothetical protein [Acidobacteriota bacterium]